MSGSAFGPGVPPDGYDPWQDPGYLAWADEVRTKMAPKMEASSLTMSIFTGKVDVKLAVEVGYALLLGKPFVLGVAPGVSVPDGLARAADAIIEIDLADIAGAARSAVAAVEQLERDGKLGDPRDGA